MRFLAPMTLLLVLLGLSTGTLRLWDLNGPELVPAGRYVIGMALISGLLCVVTAIRNRRLPTKEELCEPRVWILGLVILFVSDWICRPYAFFQGPTIRGELMLVAIGSYLLLRGQWRPLVLILPVAAAIFLFSTFIWVSGGNLLVSDDHAMFLFRLRLLKENFPSIPFWSPLWNGGFDARDFFATGALNAFLIASPLVYLFEVEQTYNIIVACFLWILTPAATYTAARLLDRSRDESAVAALLVMCTGLTWYRWALTYGTMGFLVSTALFPLAVALSLRFLSDDSPRMRELAMLVVAVTLMLLWSLSGIALAPMALLALPYAARILRSRKHVLTILLVIAINLPWVLMLWKVSSVGRFLNSDAQAAPSVRAESYSQAPQPPADSAQAALPQGSTFRHKKGGFSIRKSIDTWQESSGSLNPLILVLAIPALISLEGLARRGFGAVTVWLVLLGTVGVSLKPQLELDRMIVMAAVLVCIPVGQFIVKLFRAQTLGRLHAFASSAAGAFLLTGPLSTSAILHNRSFDQFHFAEPAVQELSEAIKRHARGGRALFTGCVTHEMSGGHLAPLALWSETPLVASSYAHNIWKYEQPIPKSYISRKEQGIREFFDHMNATLVLAHEPEYRRELASRPDLYTELWRGGRFVLFERLGYTPSYAFEGEISSLTQNHNSVTLVPESTRAVLKFRYFPFLATDVPGCSIRPYPVAPELEFIELSDCPLGKEVTIRSISPRERLLGGAHTR
jgi:hypothetical protein